MTYLFMTTFNNKISEEENEGNPQLNIMKRNTNTIQGKTNL